MVDCTPRHYRGSDGLLDPLLGPLRAPGTVGTGGAMAVPCSRSIQSSALVGSTRRPNVTLPRFSEGILRKGPCWWILDATLGGNGRFKVPVDWKRGGSRRETPPLDPPRGLASGMSHNRSYTTFLEGELRRAYCVTRGA